MCINFINNSQLSLRLLGVLCGKKEKINHRGNRKSTEKTERNNLRIIFYLILSFALFFTACGSAPKFTTSSDKDNSAAEELKEDNINVSDFTPLEIEYGVASYYADEFHGRKTANGETYNMYGISAAHIKYPLGTIIKVTNLSNNLSIILRINDRMPDIHNRIIDLSLGAAKKLDMIKSGTAKVKIEVIKWGKGRALNKKGCRM